MKSAIILFTMLFAAAPLSGVTSQPLPRDLPVYETTIAIDRKIMDGEFTDVIPLLEDYFADPPNSIPPFEFSWRLAQAHLYAGEDLLNSGADRDQVAEWYDQAEYWVERTLELAPEQHHGYFWRAALVGQRGVLRGPLNSLFAAPDMRDLLVQAAEIEPYAGHVYYTASLLYHQLPRIISFGNRDTAVSLARVGVAYQKIMAEFGVIVEEMASFRLQLARSLWTRNWSRNQRLRYQQEKREALKQVEQPFERAKLFEGRYGIPSVSDREEAMKIIEEVEDMLSSPERQRKDGMSWMDRRDQERAQELRDSWAE